MDKGIYGIEKKYFHHKLKCTSKNKDDDTDDDDNTETDSNIDTEYNNIDPNTNKIIKNKTFNKINKKDEGVKDMNIAEMFKNMTIFN